MSAARTHSKTSKTVAVSNYSIRLYCPDDAPALLMMFQDTVHRVNIRDYSAQQVAAWAPTNPALLKSLLPKWANRFENRIAYVAVDHGLPVGFADMTRQGHLDRLFVSADHQRQGIATALFQRLVDEASCYGITQITTEASITAKPFFMTLGFTVVREQSVRCNDQKLTNFKMERILAPQLD